MNRYKVYVYAISKNEEAFASQWALSMSEADGIFVTDTGSQDRTVEVLKSHNVQVFQEKIQPWRFDTARNLSLSHVPPDGDICVCTDLDEKFLPGWRQALENAWEPGTHMGNYLYNWSLSPEGKPYVQMIYFKVHSRFDYVWEYPVHECLRYTGTLPEKKCFIPGMVLNHYPDPQKSRSSYLPLLLLGVREAPHDPRMSYYLGREYMYQEQWEDCIRELKRYLSLPAAIWKEERWAAMRWIAASYARLSRVEEAFSWYLKAIAQAPNLRDAYVEAALLAYSLSDWETCFYMCHRTLQITEKSPVFVNAGYAWDHTPWDLSAIACFHLNMYQRALDHARQALLLSPHDARLKKNLEIIASYAETSPLSHTNSPGDML